MSVFHISLSGLTAQAKRLSVSADNLANLRSAGVDPAAESSDGAAADPVFRPQRVIDVARSGGGVRAEAVPVSPPSVPLFDPSDPRADANGLVHRPNVSLEEELVTQKIAQHVFRANLRALQAQNEMLGTLLDLKT